MFYLELTEIDDDDDDDDDDDGIYRQNRSQLTKICLSIEVIAIDYFWYVQMMFLQIVIIISIKIKQLKN